MTTKIDKFGRILIPKPVRERMGLRPGSPVSLVEAEGGSIEIKAEPRAPLVARRGGLLVYTGPAGGDSAETLRALREERDARNRSAGS
jgi:AbrB family looped-hinge helix DNA binding protein